MRAYINILSRFLSWFEDNFGEEDWLNPNSENPDGEWVSYLELPEYKDAKRALENIIQHLKNGGI